MLCANQTRLRARERWKCFKKQTMGCGRVKRDSPLASLERGAGTLSPKGVAGHRSSQTDLWQGAADLSTCCDTSVFAEPGASVASSTNHLLENMCVKSAKMSKTLSCACRMNLGLSSSFFYIPESKKQVCT